ncbi:MAG: guanylate kinase [Coprothermobacterota bacterium]|jgi:guanylate kinase|nr:guanylate kinase [Caldisericota bacterium]MDI6869598.1 guanylate kinase [Coprothermobacterota bacterium]
MRFPNLLVVISGPSGVGKGTLVSRYMEKHPESYLSISLTTRQPRPYEICGKDYYFVSKAEFQRYIESQRLLEWAEVFGDLYGTPRDPVEEALQSGKDAILEIDVQGGLRVKNCVPEAVLIFVLPPTREELRKRLMKRGTENPSQLQHRLEVAEIEFKYISYYDYYLINDVLDVAVADLEKIVFAEKHRVSRVRHPLLEGGDPLVRP